MTKEELRLLLVLESSAVEYGGRYDPRPNEVDILDRWHNSGYVRTAWVATKGIAKYNLSYWVELSDQAWADAHAERRVRAERLMKRRRWWRW